MCTAQQQSTMGVGGNAQIGGEPRLWGPLSQADSTSIYQVPPGAGPAVRVDSGFHVVNTHKMLLVLQMQESLSNCKAHL